MCYAYIFVKGTITVVGPNNNAFNKKLALRNIASFINCISNINNTINSPTGA